MKVFNLNNCVYVKLNDYGKEILEKRNQNLIEGFDDVVKNTMKLKFPKPNDEGYYYFQGWELMSIFGGCMFCGGESPFENLSIAIGEESLIDVED